MKEIQNYSAPKYADGSYERIEDGIYRYDGNYVTSLSFVQEPKYGEGRSAADITQVPFEDILDKFGCWVSDFYDDLNTSDSVVCYQEFASFDLKDIQALRTIIGKHIYAKQSFKNKFAEIFKIESLADGEYELIIE